MAALVGGLFHSTDGAKRELYLRLALHYRELVANMRKAVATKTVTAYCCHSPILGPSAAPSAATPARDRCNRRSRAKLLRCGSCGHRQLFAPETHRRAPPSFYRARIRVSLIGRMSSKPWHQFIKPAPF